jgi:hypothetical protein
VGHVEAHFGPFGDSANLDTRYVHCLRRTYQRLENQFWTHPTELLGVGGHVESHLSPFGNRFSVGAR